MKVVGFYFDDEEDAGGYRAIKKSAYERVKKPKWHKEDEKKPRNDKRRNHRSPRGLDTRGNW
jgi:hypothetical protein